MRGRNSARSKRAGGASSDALRTTAIPPHHKYPQAVWDQLGKKKPDTWPPQGVGKPKRQLGNPIADPKAYPRFIPPPPASRGNLSLDMGIVLAQEAATAKASNSLVFHAVGDTGGVHGDDVEKAISIEMDRQLSKARSPALAPAFYYNLGDVVYFNGESKLYDNQFYEPYQGYHAQIFAIPGNHDGDTVVRKGDPPDTEPTLFGFMKNFCDNTSEQVTPYRWTQTQPYVYWTFNTPLATIIGLYSNVDGSLDARGTEEQQDWFEKQMVSAPSDRALIVAVHHPPYSLDTTHGGYPDIGISIDRAIQTSGRIPTLVLSGHVHSYQRFQRTLRSKQVPYIIAGAGGYANKATLLHKIEKDANGNPLPDGFQTTLPDLKLMAHNDQDPGFLRITIDGKKKQLTADYFVVPFDRSASTLFDTLDPPVSW